MQPLTLLFIHPSPTEPLPFIIWLFFALSNLVLIVTDFPLCCRISVKRDKIHCDNADNWLPHCRFPVNFWFDNHQEFWFGKDQNFNLPRVNFIARYIQKKRKKSNLKNQLENMVPVVSRSFSRNLLREANFTIWYQYFGFPIGNPGTPRVQKSCYKNFFR